MTSDDTIPRPGETVIDMMRRFGREDARKAFFRPEVLLALAAAIDKRERRAKTLRRIQRKFPRFVESLYDH